MNGQKQIEEMARDLSETYKGNDCLFTNACDICEYRKYQGNKEYPCGAMKHAKEMIVRGYRKVDNGCTIKMQGESELSKVFNEFLEGNTYVKQKQGEWIKRENKSPTQIEAYCSICGRDVVYQVIDNKWEFENFCPHCGAKMRGE